MTQIMKTKLKMAAWVALSASVGLTAFAAHGKPHAKTVETTAPAAVSEPTNARNASTYLEDRRLTNSCVENGFSKSECLCVTKVTKFETKLSDYRALIDHYTSRPELFIQASASNGQTASVQTGRTAMSALIDSPNFEYRCADAHRYFETNRPR